MKKRFSQVAGMLCVMVMIVGMFGTAALAEESNSADNYAVTTKIETIYGLLNNDGSVKEILVVNILDGEYTDYGEYTNIKNLSTSSEPIIDGDKIQFPDETVEGGLYYQGTIEGELPLSFDIRYYLNEEQADPETLGGASGLLRIEIAYTENAKCEEAVREGLMAQITLKVDMNNASNINVNDGSAVVAGNMMNVNYTVMNGQTGTAVLEMDVNNFEMDSISITLLRGSLPTAMIEDSIGALEDGFDDMLDASEEMVSGTVELKDGLTDLVEGIQSLDDGMNTLSSSGVDVTNGMIIFNDGLKYYVDGTSQLAAGSTEIQESLNILSENGAAIVNGLSAIEEGLGKIIASDTDLEALVESLAESDDPSVQALAQGLLETLNAVEQLYYGFEEASEGISQYTVGVDIIAENYSSFNAGIQQLTTGGTDLNTGYNDLSTGVQQYIDGVGTSAGGVNTLYESIQSLPDDIQLMIDGQYVFRDSIAEAKDSITRQMEPFTADTGAAVSFASPYKNNPTSVQYILMTQGITILEPEEAEEAEEADETILSRFADLFR